MNEIGEKIWVGKYSSFAGESFLQGCKRVVGLMDGWFSASEQQNLFYYLYQQKFSPGGRVWFSAGKDKPQFANCALFDVQDNKESWAKAMYQNTLALTTGMGVGNYVNAIRERGSLIKGSGGTASGTLSIVSMINEVARHIMQGNTRRSACYSAVNWKHKDVYSWLNIKDWNEDYQRMKSINYEYPAPLDMHNISIQYDNDFLQAYSNIEHELHSYAVRLFDEHTKYMFRLGDPSIQFDTDNQVLRNACGEVISARNGDTCLLASINLANINTLEELYRVTYLVAKFLMVVKAINNYPTDEMQNVALEDMRLGLGIMGMHNWLLNRAYNYAWNNELEKLFQIYNEAGKSGMLEAVKQYGFNKAVAIFAQAPTGSISRLCGGVSGGIEPIFAAAYEWVFQYQGERITQTIIDPFILDMLKKGKIKVTDNIEDALSLCNKEGFERRVYMQTKIQQYTDNAISSTINLPAWGTEGNDEQTLNYYRSVLLKYMPGMRGITVYPDSARAGQPMTKIPLYKAIERKGIEINSSYSNCSNGLCSA